ncbi:hypothetical protein NCS55_00279900 [Fusarium keratoplasticum]|nr:hypothetical protein NCS55_00279900 [Fusarium keratoplasticum]
MHKIHHYGSCLWRESLHLINPIPSSSGGGLDLSKLTPAQLHALGAGLAGRPTGQTAGVTKTQTDVQPGQGTSKYAQARREKAAAKATTTSSPPPPPRHADDLVGDRPGLHKDRCPLHLRRRRRSHSRARSQSHHGRLYLEVVWATFQVALGITGLSAASFLKTLYSTRKTPTVHCNVPV